jgi:hypothetical protein
MVLTFLASKVGKFSGGESGSGTAGKPLHAQLKKSTFLLKQRKMQSAKIVSNFPSITANDVWTREDQEIKSLMVKSKIYSQCS